jgi:hypothetical protein
MIIFVTSKWDDSPCNPNAKIKVNVAPPIKSPWSWETWRFMIGYNISIAKHFVLVIQKVKKKLTHHCTISSHTCKLSSYCQPSPPSLHIVFIFLLGHHTKVYWQGWIIPSWITYNHVKNGERNCHAKVNWETPTLPIKHCVLRSLT